MGVVVKVFPDDISKMAGGAAGIAFAVTVRIRTEGSIIAAGVCAIVRAGQEMMFSVCFESALVADAVVHTNMLTVVNNGITIFAEKMVIVVIITPDCMFMAAIKFVKAAEIAYVPNSVMGFYVTEIGKTVRAVFDMAFTSGRGVGYVFMRAFRIRLRSAAHGAVMRAVISVRFVSRDCFVAVVAVFGMRLVIDYPAGVLMLAGCGSIGILGVLRVFGVTGVLRVFGVTGVLRITGILMGSGILGVPRVFVALRVAGSFLTRHGGGGAFRFGGGYCCRDKGNHHDQNQQQCEQFLHCFQPPLE